MFASRFPWIPFFYVVAVLATVLAGLVITRDPSCLIAIALLTQIPEVPILAPVPAQAPASDADEPSIGFTARVG